MTRPRQDETSEAHIGPGLEALQSVPFDQVMAEPAKAVCRLIVAEARSGDHAKPNVGEARAVTVATLEAEIARQLGPQETQPLPHRDSALQHEGADLIDDARALTDKPLAHPVQRLQVELIGGLGRDGL